MEVRERHQEPALVEHAGGCGAVVGLPVVELKLDMSAEVGRELRPPHGHQSVHPVAGDAIAPGGIEEHTLETVIEKLERLGDGLGIVVGG